MDEYRRDAIKKAQDDAEQAKERLMSIMDDLYSAGANRQAKSLETIIEKLEIWQNKPV